MNIYVNVNVFVYVYVCVYVYVYVYAYVGIYIYVCSFIYLRPVRECCPAKRMLNAPGQRFLPAGISVNMATWLTRLVSNTQNPKS